MGRSFNATGFTSSSLFFEREEAIFMDDQGKAYWNAVLGLIMKVLAVWFIVSYGCGILFAQALNSIHLGGYPLGFWFAQQGSMYVFVALIFIYAKLMSKIDEKFDVHED
jgi:putative solute:sodium symporter small subunit